MERRDSPFVCPVYVCAGVKKGNHRALCSWSSSNRKWRRHPQSGEERRTPICILRIRISTSFKERANHIIAIQTSRKVQRRPALCRPNVRVRIVEQEHLNLLQSSLVDEKMKT